jgi:hypothetical protein
MRLGSLAIPPARSFWTSRERAADVSALASAAANLQPAF